MVKKSSLRWIVISIAVMLALMALLMTQRENFTAVVAAAQDATNAVVRSVSASTPPTSGQPCHAGQVCAQGLHCAAGFCK